MLGSRPAILSPSLHFSPQIPPTPPLSPCLCLCCAPLLECPVLFSPGSTSPASTTPPHPQALTVSPGASSVSLALPVLARPPGQPGPQLCHPEQKPRQCSETAAGLELTQRGGLGHYVPRQDRRPPGVGLSFDSPESYPGPQFPHL